MGEAGLVTVSSNYSVKETIDRLASLVTSKGATVFARIDHAGNAAQVGLSLRPTELLIFGNAKVGTALMQENQTSGIDLPVKMLAWEDADGRVWLTYTDVAWIAKRHGLGDTSDWAIKATAALLAAASTAATS